jgi:hypothetical protein
MRDGPRPTVLVAIFLVSLIASIGFAGFPYVRTVFLVAAAICFMLLGVGLMRSGDRAKYRDPYDLGLLREIDEQEQWAQVDETELQNGADIVCPHCGHVFGGRFPVCPSCKRSP